MFMKTNIILIQLSIIIVIAFLGVHVHASEESIKVSNITGSQYNVSWISHQPCAGRVVLIENNQNNVIFYDDEGADFEGSIHYITVSGLKANTTYSFLVQSGEKVYNNQGQNFQVTTGPNLMPVGTIQPAGRVLLHDGSPAVNAIVHITINGDNGRSSLLSTQVDGNGFWYIELINAREADHQRLYQISSNHSLIISVNWAGDESAHYEGTIFDNEGGKNLYPDLVID
jgi:hypothetical protein